MTPILVKSDDVRSGRKAEARHGWHGSQWVKHRKLTNVIEQMRNVSTWSDRSKKLPSTSCVLGIRKSNEHCSKVVSGCW